jgi:hypothetical protein
MELGNLFKNQKKSLNLNSIGKWFCRIWDRNCGLFFFLFSLIILSFGAYYWHKNIFRSDWSEQKKIEYKSTHNKEVSFKEKEFNKVLEETGRKERLYQEESKFIRDIFQSYAVEIKNTNEENISGQKNIVEPNPINQVAPR